MGESVLDSRKSKDGFEYFIKWKGYSESESTWEPESNVACKFRKNHLIVYNSNENDQDSTTNEKNIDYCLVCDKNDNLIRCDSCPRSFHLKCIGMKEKDAAGTSSWHCEICKNSEKRQSENVMKGDISHDIINKVFTFMEKKCLDHEKKLSILCKIHELITFLINDEFGRYFSEPVETLIYHQIIKDPKDLTTIAMNLINGTYLQDASSALSRKDINVCDLNENTFDEIILAVLNDIEKVWQNCFVFNEEGSAMYRIGKIMQEKYHTISQRSFYNDLTPDIKLDLVKYIKECSKEQQQILSPDNRKNHKLLDNPIKRKKDTVTESSLVTLEMKESSHQLDTSTIELTKFRSNKNDGSFLSRNEELQLDTSFTQCQLKKKIKNTNTKKKGKQLQKQIFQKEKCKEHSTKPTIDRDNLDFCLVCDKPDDLICCDICPSSFHLKCIGMKKKDAAGTSSWHCEICQNSEKELYHSVMKGDISHDIINKVFAPLKISCRGYRKKISILCKIHELVTFLINDELGRFFSEQIKISLYLKFIKDPKDLTTIVMNLIIGTYLQDASSTLSRKDINVCNLNENTFDEIILAVLNDIEKVWQNCFVFNEEGSAMYRIGKIM